MPGFYHKFIIGFLLGAGSLLLTQCDKGVSEVKDASTGRGMEISFPLILRNELSAESKEFGSIATDTARARLLLGLGYKYPVFNTIIYRHLISVIKGRSNLPSKVEAYRRLALVFSNSSQVDSSEFYLREGIKYCGEGTEWDDLLSELYRDLGNLHVRYSRDAEAYASYDKALEIAMRRKNNENISRYITEIGRIFLHKKEYSKAASYFGRGAEYGKVSGNASIHVYALNSMGDLARLQKKYEESIMLHDSAIRVHRRATGQQYEQWACTSLGKSYGSMQDHSAARKYFNIVLEIARNNAAKDLIAQAYLNLSICDMGDGDIKSSILNGLRAYEAGKMSPPVDIKAAVAKNLAVVYKNAGQFEQAFVYLNEYHRWKDSLVNNENTRRLAEAEYKSKENKLLNQIDHDKKVFQLEQEKAAGEKRRHFTILAAVSIVLLLAVVFGIYIYNNLKQIRIKNKIIVDKQKEIYDSITYARRIQTSLLPTEKFISRILIGRQKHPKEDKS